MTEAEFRAFLQRIKTNPADSGFYGMSSADTANSYYYDPTPDQRRSGDEFWANPISDGQTFDQGSGLFTAGPQKSWRVTQDLGKADPGMSNAFGGGGSAIYEKAPWVDFDPNSGAMIGQGNWENMGTDKFTDIGSWLTALASMAVAGGAVAGGAAMGAGSGAAGAGSGAAGSGALGAGASGLGGATAADIGMMYAGADAAAAAGLGAAPATLGGSVGGTAALGAGAAGLGGGGSSSLGTLGSLQNVLSGTGTASDWLSLGGTALGALGGSQGTQSEQSATRQLPGFLQGPVANDLVPRAQGLLATQMPQAQQAGAMMMAQGGNLLNAPVAGNGVGKVNLNAPTTATNPYLSGMADDISRRTSELLGQNNASIQGQFIGAGGLGNSRQGIAQGVAAGKAADYLQGNLANLYGTQYSNDQNRALQQYGMDQNFYGQQRGQDLTQVGVGSGLLGQGFETQWGPLKNAANTYSPFTGFGTTTQNSEQGGGWMGALGGALGAAQFGKNQGWW